jgi:2-polyprenyl-3-methyl-5-hydroxy-6-metoxy-1,4-benzoquinol methylase
MNFDKYNALGAYHHRWYYDINHHWYKDCVNRVVGFCKGDTLDLGCGDGLVMKLIIENGYTATGIDSSALALKFAQELTTIPKEQLWRKDINNLVLYKDNWWEYMCCLNSIEHLEKPEVLKRIIRNNVLKGAIIITDKAVGPKGRYHFHEYTKDELMAMFQEFNPKFFEINSLEGTTPVSFIGVEIKK